MSPRFIRCSTLLLFLLCFAGCGLFAESVKTIPPPTNYVTDLAGVLNDSTKSDLNALGSALDTQAHAQLFVVTIHKIDDDEPVEQFANELFAKWKIGPAKTDRGILMLFSIEDRKRWIEVGYGLEGILPDAKVGDVGREMVPDLQAGDYDGAVRGGFNSISNVIAQDAGVTLSIPTHQYHRQSASRGSGGGIGIFGLIVIVAIVLALMRGGGGGPGGLLTGLLLGNLLGGGRRYGGGGGGFDGGGGGFGGDGGGGGFGGGGGGSSGGGGAGGSW